MQLQTVALTIVPAVAPARTSLPRRVAWSGVARCVGRSAGMLVRREVHFPRSEVGRRIGFADHTTARVYRDTAVARAVADPCRSQSFRGSHSRSPTTAQHL